MRHYIMRFLVIIAVLASMTHAAQALTIFDEATLGDFSDSGLAPTLLSLAPGVNIVRTTTGPSASDHDDYFQIDLASMTLLSIVVQGYIPGPGNASTLLENCNHLSPSCTQTGPGGQVSVTIADIARDVMPDLVQGIGLTDYFRIGESRGPAALELAFTTTTPLTPTPEPSTWLLFGTGLMGCISYSWRRRKQATTTV